MADVLVVRVCSHMFQFCQFGELVVMEAIFLTAGSRVDHSNGRGLEEEEREGRGGEGSETSVHQCCPVKM